MIYLGEVRRLTPVVLVFNIFLGLTLSVTQTSKSINFEYETLRPASYGFDLQLNLNEKYFMQLDVKRLGAGVQSQNGFLNIFGWDYTHDITALKLGYNLNEENSFYLAPVFYYMPVLFPTQVGALSSVAAFEKTFTYGLAVGYQYHASFKKIDFLADASLGLLDFASSEYDSNYGYFLDVDLHPTYNLNESIKLGLNYNLVFGQHSLVENKTGEGFPFKTRFFLHNLFFTFAYRFF